MVWVKSGSGSTKINVLKKEEITISLNAAQQYIGGQWKNVEAYAYIGGKWVQFSWLRKYIQKNTDVLTPISFTNAKKTVLANGIKYSQNGSNSRVTVAFGPIDLTNCNTLCCSVLSGYAWYNEFHGMCVSKNKLTGYPSSDKLNFSANNESITPNTYKMDISAYSGLYFVSLAWEGKATNDTYFSIESIWME